MGEEGWLPRILGTSLIHTSGELAGGTLFGLFYGGHRSDPEERSFACFEGKWYRMGYGANREDHAVTSGLSAASSWPQVTWSIFGF